MEVGSDVGGYTLVRRIGSGGMGTVWEARDGANRTVALKLLHPGISTDPEARERLRREVESLHRLRGARVAHVLDAELTASSAFIVTELIDGLSLEDSVAAEGAFDPLDLHPLAQGLYEALADVHAAGLLHRDIKPGNVMVTYSGPVLIDFGIAQLAEDTRLTRTGFVTGTPGYLDPVALHGGALGRDGDWFGLAAVLLFAATGRPPFGAGRLDAVLARMSAGTPDVEGLEPGVASAFRAALAPDPALRPPREALLEALELWAEGLEVPVPGSVDGGADAVGGAEGAEGATRAEPGGDRSWSAPADLPTVVVPPGAAITEAPPAAVSVPTSSSLGVTGWRGRLAAMRARVGLGPGRGSSDPHGEQRGVRGETPQHPQPQRPQPQRPQPQHPGSAGRQPWQLPHPSQPSRPGEVYGSSAPFGLAEGAWPPGVPGPVGMVPAWAVEPAPRGVLVVAGWAVVCGVAARWPGIAVILALAAFTLLTLVGMLYRRTRQRRLRAGGPRPSDIWVARLWALPLLLPAAVVSLLPLSLGGIVAASVWAIGAALVSTDGLGVLPAGFGVLVAPLALSAGLALAWRVPISSVARTGARVVWERVEPVRSRRRWWVLAAVAVVLVLVVIGMFGEPVWAPFPVPGLFR